MWRIAYWIARMALSLSNLGIKERNLFTSLILDKLDALPIRDIISVSDAGEILISGNPITYEEANMLRMTSKSVLDNRAFRIVCEQVERIAVTRGLHNGDTPDKIFFYRSALWFAQELRDQLRYLAGETESHYAELS